MGEIIMDAAAQQRRIAAIVSNETGSFRSLFKVRPEHASDWKHPPSTMPPDPMIAILEAAIDEMNGPADEIRRAKDAVRRIDQ